MERFDMGIFKNRLTYYKEYLQEELPEFTIEEILKIDTHFQKLKKYMTMLNHPTC